MGDIKFKICGDETPFNVKLLNSSCSTVLQQKTVEYSGTCVVFSELAGNTCYNVCIEDNINCGSISGFVTPSPLTPPAPPEKTINLLGSVVSECGSSISKQVVSPKCVEITPPLIAGDCVDLNFNLITCNILNTLNSVSISCNNTLVKTLTNFVSGSQNYSLNMKYGDTVCYGISSVSNLPSHSVLYPIGGGDPVIVVDVCGCARLTLTSANGCNFDACLGTTSLETKIDYDAPSAPPPDLVDNCISLNITNRCFLPERNVDRSARISTSIPLSGNESFRLHYVLCSVSSVSNLGGIPVDLCAFSCAPQGFQVASSVDRGNRCSDNKEYCGFIDVDSSNIGAIGTQFRTRACLSSLSSSGQYANSACVRLLCISRACSSTSNFVIAGTQTMFSRNLSLIQIDDDPITTIDFEGNTGFGELSSDFEIQ